MLSISGQAFNALEQSRTARHEADLRNLLGLWLGRSVPDNSEVIGFIEAARADPLQIDPDPADQESLLIYGALIEACPMLTVERVLLAIDLVFDRRPPVERMSQLRAMRGQ